MAPRKRGVERIGSLESILKAAHGLTVLRSLRTNPAGTEPDAIGTEESLPRVDGVWVYL